MVRKVPGKRKWCVWSKSTGRKLGCYPSRKKALARERQIQVFKNLGSRRRRS